MRCITTARGSEASPSVLSIGAGCESLTAECVGHPHILNPSTHFLFHEMWFRGIFSGLRSFLERCMCVYVRFGVDVSLVSEKGALSLLLSIHVAYSPFTTCHTSRGSTCVFGRPSINVAPTKETDEHPLRSRRRFVSLDT